MGRVYFSVAAELLAEALHLPKGSSIRMIIAPDTPKFGGSLDSDVYEFVVEHPDLPEGCAQGHPEFTKDERGMVRFKTWGVE